MLARLNDTGDASRSRVGKILAVAETEYLPTILFAVGRTEASPLESVRTVEPGDKRADAPLDGGLNVTCQFGIRFWLASITRTTSGWKAVSIVTD